MAEAPLIPHEDTLEEIDNPIERPKLLGENEDEIARYLDALEVTSPRERDSTRLRNLYVLREIQALPGTDARWELHRAPIDATRMVDALKTRELALPTFLIGHPARRRAGIERDPTRHGWVGAGSLELDRLVRQATEGSESNVRDRLCGADGRLVDPRADPRRDRTRHLTLTQAVARPLARSPAECPCFSSGSGPGVTR